MSAEILVFQQQASHAAGEVFEVVRLVGGKAKGVPLQKLERLALGGKADRAGEDSGVA